MSDYIFEINAEQRQSLTAEINFHCNMQTQFAQLGRVVQANKLYTVTQDGKLRLNPEDGLSIFELQELLANIA